LTAKRKLDFIEGVVIILSDNLVKAEMWDICNSMVIAWIGNSISYQITKSIVNTLCEFSKREVDLVRKEVCG